MIRQSPARIYKSQQRDSTENELHRLLATFNFEGYQNESRTPFGSLLALNDETLAPGYMIDRQMKKGTLTLIIPLIGEVKYTTDTGTFKPVPGEASFTTASSININNPYDAELISFLYLQFEAPGAQDGLQPLNLNLRNTLSPFMQNTDIQGFIGIFDDRAETLHPITNPAHGIFVFVISGVFEVQGRLLEERDGLALWDTPDADIEALSENAVILLFEVPLTGFTA